MKKERLLELAGVKQQLNEYHWGADDVESFVRRIRDIAKKHDVKDLSTFMKEVHDTIREIGVD